MFYYHDALKEMHDFYEQLEDFSSSKFWTNLDLKVLFSALRVLFLDLF